MSEQSFSPSSEDEISLKDIIDFLIESWKTIILTGLFGIVGSTVYLWTVPNQYQATAQIQIGQYSTNDNSTNPLVINIESPNLLVARLKLPSTYLAKEIKACGLENSKSPSEVLAEKAKFSAIKGLDTWIDLKINHESKEIAIACAQSLFERIKTSQSEIIKPSIEKAKDSLLKYQDRSNNAKSLISRADKSGESLSAAYLSTRDELKFLSEEILRLNFFISSVDTRQVKLVSPIYVSDIPVAPKKKTILIAGLSGGLFLGLLLMIGKRVLPSFKTTDPKS
jgi:capsular polysaccharide biosynthesis protein